MQHSVRITTEPWITHLSVRCGIRINRAGQPLTSHSSETFNSRPPSPGWEFFSIFKWNLKASFLTISIFYCYMKDDHKLSACVHTKPLHLCLTLCNCMGQAPLSIGSSRQEYWTGLPCPPPEDLPNPGIKPMSLTSPALAGRFFLPLGPV